MTSLKDFLSCVRKSEGHQTATHQRSEGQQDGNGFGNAYKAGEDSAA